MSAADRFRLVSTRLGPLPLINFFLDQLGVAGVAGVGAAGQRPASRRPVLGQVLARYQQAELTLDAPE